ncbi:MAG: nicotinamide-nucleotide amidohydrolase family protein [Treponema sp.]|nr:nicotinamide-nucleotide amidohydrolase family protein [Treponema sp.]
MIDDINDLKNHAEKTADKVIEKLKTLSLKLALAESCTAGLISGLLANKSGASCVLWGSYVCYTQEAKVSMLDIESGKLNEYGLVSRQTACSMAEKALEKSTADIAASVQGLQDRLAMAVMSLLELYGLPSQKKMKQFR